MCLAAQKILGGVLRIFRRENTGDQYAGVVSWLACRPVGLNHSGNRCKPAPIFAEKLHRTFKWEARKTWKPRPLFPPGAPLPALSPFRNAIRHPKKRLKGESFWIESFWLASFCFHFKDQTQGAPSSRQHQPPAQKSSQQLSSFWMELCLHAFSG